MTATAATAIPWENLISAALDVQKKAHAPYSKFRVGAALLTSHGTVFVGANVENASFGATICAERSAICAMVAAGERELRALAVVTPGQDAASPCGICRQVLAEFAIDIPVVLVADERATERHETKLSQLLPDAFRFERA